MIMSLSKNNLDKLKFILKKESFKNKSPDNDNPEELFYSIIDNCSNLEETIFISPKLKKAEDNLFKSKIDKYNSNNYSQSSDFNNELSEEEILYDEFKYLLEE